jgi:hypothetical protein
MRAASHSMWFIKTLQIKCVLREETVFMSHHQNAGQIHIKITNKYLRNVIRNDNNELKLHS